MSIQWLRERVPGFRDLTSTELEAVSDFTLLWSLFEARVLDQQGNARAIGAAVERWRRQGGLDDDPYRQAYAYFQLRYYAGGRTTAHYAGLRFRANDMEPQVRAALDGTDPSAHAQALAVFVVIYRYRNNLFHGGKWDYGLADQLDNFRHANVALTTALDRHGVL